MCTGPYELILPEQSDNIRLDHAVALLFPELGLRGRRRMCEEGRVFVDGRPSGPGVRVRAGQRLAAARAEPLHPEFLPPIICQNFGLAALDKPAGLACANLAGGRKSSLEAALPQLFPNCSAPFPLLLNRLDTETSGLVLAALAPEGEALWRSFENAGLVKKCYLTVVSGLFPPGEERILDAALDMDNRKTTRVLPHAGPFVRHTRVCGLALLPGRLSLVGCVIMRGARHQIRAHLAGAGFPLWRDIRYSSPSASAAAEPVSFSFFSASFPCSGFLLHHAFCRVGSFFVRSLPGWLDLLPSDAVSAALTWLEAKERRTEGESKSCGVKMRA